MANRDAPSGFKPVRYLSGQCYDGAAVTMRKEASVILGIGDPVVLTGSASQAGTNNADRDGVPLVTRAAAGSGTITGVVVGLQIDSDLERNTHTKHMAAADTGYVRVCTAKDVVYEIQEDSDTSNIAVTDVGEFCDIVIGNANTDTGYSIAELDSSNAGTGDQVRILGLVQREDNALGANAKWEVTINEATLDAVSTPI